MEKTKKKIVALVIERRTLGSWLVANELKIPRLRATNLLNELTREGVLSSAGSGARVMRVYSSADHTTQECPQWDPYHLAHCLNLLKREACTPSDLVKSARVLTKCVKLNLGGARKVVEILIERGAVYELAWNTGPEPLYASTSNQQNQSI